MSGEKSVQQIIRENQDAQAMYDWANQQNSRTYGGSQPTYGSSSNANTLPTDYEIWEAERDRKRAAARWEQERERLRQEAEWRSLPRPPIITPQPSSRSEGNPQGADIEGRIFLILTLLGIGWALWNFGTIENIDRLLRSVGL